MKNRIRNSKGSGLVQSVGSIAMITAIIVGMCFALLNAGIAFCYKQKLAYVALECARYANGMDRDGRLSETKAFADDLLRTLKVPYGGIHIELDEVKEHGDNATRCTVQCRSLGLIGNMFGLIDMEGSAVAPKNELIVGRTLCIENGSNNVYVPVIEDQGSDASVGSFASKGYLAINSENEENRPRLLHWALAADYKEASAASQTYDDVRKPKAHSVLQNLKSDYPYHLFNGVYYVEIASAGAVY
ncbi:MAG: hypothetical protein K2X77_04675 [Candidatus Obscuribacterales bacterium]|nr:hypothetical protein [Candidatus Obscuribacterales bacterium]